MDRPQADASIEGSDLDALREAADRVLADDGFSAGPRGRQLLSYIVREEAAGRGEAIKGYTLGVEVLGRDESFDPQADSIVRVEMGRLRKALDLYYATTGKSDPDRIVIPTGRYRPKLERAAAAPEAPVGEGTAPVMSPHAAQTDAAYAPSANAEYEAAVSGYRSAADQVMRPVALRLSPLAIAVTLTLPVLIGLIAFRLLGFSLVSDTAEAPPPVFAQPGPVVVQAPAPLTPPSETVLASAPQISSLAPPPAPLPRSDAGWLPQIAMRVELAGDEHSLGLARMLRGMISKFDQVRVGVEIREGPAEEPDPAAAPPEPQNYELVISKPAVDSELPITASLRHLATDELVWEKELPSFEAVSDDAESQSVEAKELASVAARLSSSRGVILGHYQAFAEDNRVMKCLMSGMRAQSSGGASARADALECLEELTHDGPTVPWAYALKARLFMDEEVETKEPLSRSGAEEERPYEKALAAARAGLEVAPESAAANIAMMIVEQARGAPAEAAQQFGENAILANPNDPAVLANMGAHQIIFDGAYAQGRRSVEKAFEIAPQGEPWWSYMLFLAAFATNDDEAAIQAAAQLEGYENALYLLARAIATHKQGDQDAAEILLDEAIEMDPTLQDLNTAFERRGYNQHLRDALVNALRQARRG